ncbi:elongation factor-like GTPase 1 [Drosophila guanche]|uniref:Ribosome assembly protein 1 n=1 Tax=Drosophila guanche TaxID=7266 RepID=A0A3B0KT73_DROGU|nr:elongation factor-like GTPase 1 [Drosophila guanche]XP_034136915.1 elongation factor-like GTPase 1 [Drosophila guanche]SPP87098.1 blast:Elongation factor Tu GTP-binding domain-containing protein 1 [Drosophila guanche]
MPVVEGSDLALLQRRQQQVRNICILAHVDHGKTTLADSLVASNGIISQRMAGKLRYLDNRQDEQERGITMKSSSISLHYKEPGKGRENDFLVNLIDSPGHVDFSSEVSTAVRLCDGAIVVVDVVEGVGAQTRACLKQIYEEQLKPVLVLNKLDRLILEKQMEPLDAYFHLTQVLEQVNAVLGSIFASDVLAREDITQKDNQESALEEVDDSELYFSPSSGNVVFSSAYDGWAFSVRDFAAMYDKRLEMKREELEQVLWGDFYYNSKKKCAMPGAQEKAKKPMFVQFVLENIWSMYDIIAVRKDKDKLPAIAEKLGLKLAARDLRLTDPKLQIKAVLGQWLPIDSSVLHMVVQHVPPPHHISEERAQRLLYPANIQLSSLPAETLKLKESFTTCDAGSDNVIAFVSKMTPVHVSQLPQNRPKRMTDQELQTRRDEVRRRIEERKQQSEQTELDRITAGVEQLSSREENIPTEPEPEPEPERNEFVFVAFARVFSGTLRRGMELFNLSPKHDPRQPSHRIEGEAPHASRVTIGDLYMFMGGELQLLDEVPAGNIVGIGGLEAHIVKTATLSSTLDCTSFSELSIMATPILRVAIEPVQPQDMPQLVKGLKLLNQADACVQVSVAPTGEHVITTLGEVHVEKCVHDLEQSYAKVKVNVSKPIVSFRETIVPAATVDMVNEAIVKTAEDKDVSKKIALQQTLNKLGTLRAIALPLPPEAVELLEKHTEFFKELSATPRNQLLSEKYATLLASIKLKLIAALQDLPLFGLSSLSPEELVSRLWALGPRNCGTNLLLNLTDYEQPDFWSSQAKTSDTEIRSLSDPRKDFNSSLVNGFQLTCGAGPLCEEPMQGVCFAVLEWSIQSAGEDLNAKGPFSGQVLTAAKEVCRQAFQNQPQRLVTPMYSCTIVVNAEMLGKMYAVIGRRHGKILSGDLTQGSGNFSVTCLLPVIESFNFAQEMRKQTSGLACPQLMFSHWEVIDIDPFWLPTTEEELMHFGEKADSANRAKVYMDSVRRRKGLFVDEQVVEHAEKQRTLSKNK